MELQFEKTAWECLRPAVSQVKNEEQTMEVRLPESMPDIGRVLASWGQVLLRGKEWRGGGMTVSGGIMAWVLYAPEDGTQEQCVETWIPFQTRWDFPQTERDGSIWVSCLLRSIDARSLAARKLMVRAGVSLMGEALEPVRLDVFTPGQVPEDIQLLKQNYPIRIPREAGEKDFALDEEVTVPPSAGQIDRLIRWELRPELIDRKVMSGKVVFRGSAQVHMLFRDTEGNLKTWNFEIPFSQFEDLEREYGPDAEARIVPAVTGMELDVLAPDRVHLKAGLVGQYVITDRTVLEIVEDAYSNVRAVTPQYQEMPLPAVLDGRIMKVKLDAQEDMDGQRIIDAAFLTGQPGFSREEGSSVITQNGAWQLLWQERDGRLQGSVVLGDASIRMDADENSRVTAFTVPTGMPRVDLSAGLLTVQGDVLVDAQTTMERGIPMVTGLELGEVNQPDPSRPSLILRRAGNRRLWDLAKASGSTMEAIRIANGLEGEPNADQFLLIPVS